MKPAAVDLAEIAVRAMIEKGFVPEPPADALAQAAAAEPARASEGLRDLRELLWTSIDNVESRDLDQVEVIEKVGADTRLRVGIADVDHVVPADSPVDRFARANSTSVYTGARTFPMLPERLSFDLTSLVEGRPRRAMVIETLIAPDGAVKHAEVYPALVQNHAKLAYPTVSAWLEGHAPPPGMLAERADLRAQVEAQDALARTLGDARRRAGALDVDTAQPRAVLDDSGKIAGLTAHHQDRAGSVIEELMIASNRSVARTLDARGVASIRRVVKEPARWAKIVAFAAERAVTLPETPSSLALAGFVDRMRKEREREFAEISLSLIKLMGRGEYVAHRPGAPEVGHFGLATAQYTHSTAPNRRYVDLVIQRLVLGSHSYDEATLVDIATRASERESAAEKVERRVLKSASAALLSTHLGEIFDAIVTGASDKGVFVRVLSPLAEGRVVSGERGLEVSQKVRVRLRDVSVERGFIDFERASA